MSVLLGLEVAEATLKWSEESLRTLKDLKKK